MIRARAEAVRNINSAADGSNAYIIDNIFERGDRVVELDQFKTLMNAYEEPLAEMRDSL